MPTQADIDLAERIGKGDTGAFGVLLDRYWESLVRYSTGLLGNRDEAEDVAQETFTRLWERRDGWHVAGSALPLLLRITRNMSIDMLRRRSSRNRAENSIRHPTEPATPLSELEKDELRLLVATAVDALPERRREVLLLVRMHGLSRNEAAEVLDLAPQTVANHLKLAMDDIRKILAPHFCESLEEKIPAQVGDSGTAALQSVAHTHFF